jgi:tetratricopeptide (TPR) repeat protein
MTFRSKFVRRGIRKIISVMRYWKNNGISNGILNIMFARPITLVNNKCFWEAKNIMEVSKGLRTLPRNNLYYDLLSDIYIELADFTSAKLALDRLDVRSLSLDLMRKYTIKEGIIKKHENGLIDQLHYLESRLLFHDNFYDAIILYHYLETYLQVNSVVVILNKIRYFLELSQNNRRINDLIVQYLYNINHFDEVIWMMENYNISPNRKWNLLLQIHWANNDVEEVNEIFSKAFSNKRTLNNTTYSLLISMYKYLPDGTHFIDELRDYFTQKSKSKSRYSLAWANTCNTLGFYDLAIDLLQGNEDIHFGNPFYYASLAHAYFYLEDYTKAKEYCYKVLQKSYVVHGVWSILGLIQCSEGKSGIDKFIELSERKVNETEKYSYQPFDNRRNYYDVSHGQALMMQNEYFRGKKMKFEKETCRFLEVNFPKQYILFKNDYDPIPSSIESILVLGEDGVSDEIRWAQSYLNIPKTINKVKILCEPRLKDLFSRSFPDFEFEPVERRWPTLPSPVFNSHRHGVPNQDLARVVNNENYEQFSNYDLICFQQELTLIDWKKNQMADTGKYLYPCKERSEFWKERIDVHYRGKYKVGILWRSMLQNNKRNRHYLDIEDMIPLTTVVGCQLFSLQHDINSRELEVCTANSIVHFEEIDFKDDFSEVAALVENLDCVIGISSSSFEIASALGVECFLLGITPEALYLRADSIEDVYDRFSWNSTVIPPDDDSYFQMDKEKRVEHVIDKAKTLLEEKVRH